MTTPSFKHFVYQAKENENEIENLFFEKKIDDENFRTIEKQKILSIHTYNSVVETVMAFHIRA